MDDINDPYDRKPHSNEERIAVAFCVGILFCVLMTIVMLCGGMP